MNKLRINPRSNSPQKSTNLDSNKTSSNTSPKNVNQEMEYFLDKNENDFTKDDLDRFQHVNKERTDFFLDYSNRVIAKLFQISKIRLGKNNEVKESKIKDETLDTVSSLPNNFRELEPLIIEIIEDNQEGSELFITTLINALVIVDKELKNEPLNIEHLYESLSAMLQKLQDFNITQQKYIYRSIANSINHKVTNYTFISPENGNFVESKFHKIVSGSGQRVVRGLSYILLDSTNDEVLKFGHVKTI